MVLSTLKQKSPQSTHAPRREWRAHKRCALCRDYFVGELDGDYTCTTCRAPANLDLHPPMDPPPAGAIRRAA